MGDFMPDYQAMYTSLFRNVTAAIESLQNAQCQTEEMYISSEPPDIRVVEPNNRETNKTEDK